MKRISLLLFIMLGLILCKQAGAQPVQVPKTYGKPVLMHYMPWFDTPQYGGAWGWHWTMNNKNPDIITDPATGKRQIASHYYPLIGPYGSRDPDVVEYHLLLMKYAGIDGILVDWYGVQGSNPDVGGLLVNSNALINQTDEVGLKFGLVLEDRFTASVSQGQANMAYARDNYFNRANYYRHGTGNDPLVGVFGPITFQSPSQWSDILSASGEDVEFLPLWGESSDAGTNADGEYVWVWEDENLDNYYTHMQSFYQNSAPSLKTVMGVAYPGFHDFYAEGGAGSSYFNIPYNGTGTLSQTLNLVNQYSSQVDILQLATWNDFGEGTIFEPTQEFGYSFLTTLQQFLGVPYGEYELQQIYRLYTLRKQYAGDAAKQAQLAEAFNHFVALRVSQAVAVLDAIDGGTNPPSACTTITLSHTLQAENYCHMAGIQFESTTDSGGGQNAGWIDTNDYLTYQISVPTTGTYSIQYRVASESGGGNIRLERADGSVVYGTIAVPATGGWQTWTTINHTVQLPAGQYEIAIVAATGGFNINWWSASQQSNPPVASSYRIKNKWQNTYLYDAGDRVRYSSTASGSTYEWVLEDAGSGLFELKNVSTGEYMHIEHLTGYVECTTRTPGWYSSRWFTEDAGSGYVRIKSAWQSTQYIHVENLAGHAQYGTIYPAWESAQWLLEPVSTSASAYINMESTPEVTEASTLKVYPNPLATEVLTIQYTGELDANSSLTIYSMSGTVLKAQKITEAKTELTRGNLKAGIYLLQIQGRKERLIRKLILE